MNRFQIRDRSLRRGIVLAWIVAALVVGVGAYIFLPNGHWWDWIVWTMIASPIAFLVTTYTTAAAGWIAAGSVAPYPLGPEVLNRLPNSKALIGPLFWLLVWLLTVAGWTGAWLGLDWLVADMSNRPRFAAWLARSWHEVFYGAAFISMVAGGITIVLLCIRWLERLGKWFIRRQNRSRVDWR